MSHCLWGVKDDLHDFAEWVQGNVAPLLMDVPISVEEYGPTLARVLYRKGNFQVEHVYIRPNQTAPKHRHPHVDSIECGVRGEALMTINGVTLAENHSPERREAFLKGRLLRINHDAWHGAEIGKAGLVFLSVQRWKDGVAPTHIGRDWEGTPATKLHEDLIRKFEA